MKVEVALPEKPEVWQIAGILGIDSDAVVGKLFKVWRWFDAHTESGNAVGVSYPLVDHVAGVSGFAEAMALCGWLLQNGSTIVLPNFDRHNGKTAKNRALTAKRVAKHVGKTNAVTNAPIVSSALPREEKRREEEKPKSAPTGADLLPDVDPVVVRDFLRVRKEKRAPLTATAVEGIRREAEKANLTIESALRICCEKGWAGFSADWKGITQPSQSADVPGGGRKRLP
jgi:hypothetical protein